MNGRRQPHTLADWLARLQAAGWEGRKVGAVEWSGPCPLCGGRDRFHVREGRTRTLAGCRHGCTFEALARWLWPPAPRRRPVRPSRARKRWQPAQRPGNGPRGDSGRFRAARANSDPHTSALTAKLAPPKGRGTPDFGALAEAVEAGGPLHSDAAAWLRGRGLDPERLHVAGWRSLTGPEALALARQSGAYLPGPTPRARLVVLIPVVGFDGRPRTVRVRPIDPTGPTLTLPGDTARPYGADSLQALAVAPDGGTIHVCEGEADRESLFEAGALAAIGLPGASTCHDWLAEHLPPHRPRRVALWFDGDEAGRKAGEALAGRLTAQGLTVRRWAYLAGQDVNDHWRADPDGLRRAVQSMEATE